eukprot:2103_1
MSNSKKRKFTDLSNNSLISLNQFKKRKSRENESTNKIKSIFSNATDHTEFVTYFNAIKQSPLSNLLHVSLDIMREIAEFAPGIIEKCSNNHCNVGICVLNKHWDEFNNNKPSKWTYCVERNKYFCDMCLPHTTRFICCNTIQCYKHYEACWWISNIDTMCLDDINDEYVMGYKCAYCDDQNGNCNDCKEWNCSFHREIMTCNSGMHNMCCQVYGCDSCDGSFCDSCDGKDCGNICGKCCEFWCVSCSGGKDFKKKENTCDYCCGWICVECMKKNPVEQC